MNTKAVRAGAAGLLAATCLGCSAEDRGEPEAAAATPSGPRQLEIADSVAQAGNPEWLHEAFGISWVLADDGHVYALDPGTGGPSRTIDTGYHSTPACQGLGADETALWTCAGTDALARIDPTTGALTKVPASKRSDEGRLAFSAGLLWYLESGSNDLVGLDATPAEVARVPLGEVCTDLAFDDHVVFALCPTTHQVLRVDPASRTVTGSLDINDPRAAAVGEDLFVGDGGRMVQVDPDSLEVLHTYEDVGPGLLGSIDATAEEVWVRHPPDSFLTVVDPTTHEVVATVDAPGYTSSGDVLITDDWIWATSSDDNQILRVAR
jgi:streptogramin lyase